MNQLTFIKLRVPWGLQSVHLMGRHWFTCKPLLGAEKEWGNWFTCKPPLGAEKEWGNWFTCKPPLRAEKEWGNWFTCKPPLRAEKEWGKVLRREGRRRKMSQEESRELYKKNPINYIQIKSTKSAKMRSIHIRSNQNQIH